MIVFSVYYSTGREFTSHDGNTCYSSAAGDHSCSCRFNLPQKVLHNQEMKASIGMQKLNKQTNKTQSSLLNAVRFIRCLNIIKTVQSQDEEIHYADPTFDVLGFQSTVRYIVLLCEVCLISMCKHPQLLYIPVVYVSGHVLT